MSQPPFFKFEIVHKSIHSSARVGIIHTPHGIIETPNFVAVGTNGTIKAVDSTIINQLDLQLMFCNTYHLIVQPGTATVKQAGGLHTFINRKQPIITDSGGFQVFSLAYGGVTSELKSKGTKKHDGGVISITEDGVVFRSYRDGEKILLTPESSIQAQKELGADIIIPFDELPPYHIDQRSLEQSLHRTHRWEKRSLEEHQKNIQNQAIYAVIHGGINQRLRKLSIDFLSQLPFDGYAIGGSIGKERQEMFDLLDFVVPQLPENKPNHLLGIADLLSIDQLVKKGIDTFDSSYPTKVARHGLLFTAQGPIKIMQAQYKNHFRPPDETCSCMVCTNYTAAYLHHLFKAKEFIGPSLATIHNLHFMVQLMKNYREKIMQGAL